MGNDRIGVVMAGGSGERFWPLSRPDRPKQLLRLTSEDVTMLEEAVDRLVPLFGEQVFVATSASLRVPVLGSGIVSQEKVLTEPVRRNTLGAQCWIIASMIAEGLAEATMAIVTADHRIGDAERFRSSISAAMGVAEAHGGIVTIGVPPERPETGYGYIEVDESANVPTEGEGIAFRAFGFREKPSPETAEQFVEAGNFLWNSGMFFYRIPAFLEELAVAHPDSHAITIETAAALKAGDTRAAEKAFERLPSVSVDYAVMEHAKTVYVLRADFQWDDVGAWDAMERTFAPDEHGNVVRGDAVVLESSGSIVYNESTDTVLGAVGLRDMVVVLSDNAVLVCPKDKAQRVRLIAQALSDR